MYFLIFDVNVFVDSSVVQDLLINTSQYRHQGRRVQNQPAKGQPCIDLLQLLVEDVNAEAVASALQLGHEVAVLLDGINLLLEVVALQEVAEVCILLLITHSMQA